MRFAYGDPIAGRVQFFALTETMTAFPPNDVFPADDFIFEADSLQTTRPVNATFAILGTPAVPVPEINTGSLAQALFVLLALQLWVVSRRRWARARPGRHARP